MLEHWAILILYCNQSGLYVLIMSFDLFDMAEMLNGGSALIPALLIRKYSIMFSPYVCYDVNSSFADAFLQLTPAASFPVPSSNCYTFDNTSHIYDFVSFRFLSITFHHLLSIWMISHLFWWICCLLNCNSDKLDWSSSWTRREGNTSFSRIKNALYY